MKSHKTYRQGPAWAGSIESKSKGGHAGDYRGTKPEGAGMTGKVSSGGPSRKTQKGKASYKADVPAGGH